MTDRTNSLTLLFLAAAIATFGLVRTAPSEAAAPAHNLRCGDGVAPLEGTWQSNNVGRAVSGQVTFKPDGSYAIDSGTYNAGGTWFGVSKGTYEIVDSGKAIAFRYAGAPPDAAVSRIAIVECGSKNHLSHFSMGHSDDYEMLTRR